MAKSMTLDATIAATQQQLWGVLADLDQVSQWHHGVKEIKPLTDTKMRMGSSWIERRSSDGKREFVSTITANVWEPPTKFGLHVEGKMMRMDLWFLLTPAGTGTHVHYEGHIAGKGIGKLFTGKMVKMMKEIDGDLLDRLAAQVRRGTKTQPAAKPKAGAKASKKTTARKT